MTTVPAVTDNALVLGKIVSVQGIRGEVRVYSYTDPIANLLEYRHWTLRRGTELRRVEVARGRVQGNVLVVKLKGLNDRELAQTYAEFEIYIPKHELPELPAGEYYWHQLEGLKVINQAGQCLGHVHHLLETGANDVLVVRPCDGSLDDQERLLPYIDSCVQRVDLELGELYVDWDADF